MRGLLFGLFAALLFLGGCASSPKIASEFEYGSGYDRPLITDVPVMSDLEVVDLGPDGISESGDALDNMSSDFLDLLQ